MSVGRVDNEGDLRRFVQRELDRPSGPGQVLPDFGSVTTMERLHSQAGTTATGSTNILYFGAVRVLNPNSLSGVGYQVGSTSSGDVWCALYDRDGQKVADSGAGVAQGSSLALQQVAFSEPILALPGLYWCALVFSSATATFLGSVGMPSGSASQPGFAVPDSISPPVSGVVVPSMCVY